MKFIRVKVCCRVKTLVANLLLMNFIRNSKNEQHSKADAVTVTILLLELFISGPTAFLIFIHASRKHSKKFKNCRLTLTTSCICTRHVDFQ